MQFIALFVIVISLIAIAYKDLNMGLLSLAAVMMVAVLFYFLSSNEQEQSGFATEAMLTQSSISRGYAESFVLNTRITNQHESQTMRKASIRSRLADCNADQSKCLTIGEELNVVKIQIPPGQARDIAINLGIKQLNLIRGEAVWSHEVVKAQ